MGITCLLSLLALGAGEPAWYNSTIGLPGPNDVPSPYTPIKVDGRTANVVGRRIILDNSGFPQQLVSAGADLLQAPVALTARSGGKPVAWESGGLQWLEHTPSAVTWQAKGTGSGWGLTVNGRLEYDGLLRFELSLTPGPEPLDSLSLVVPMVPERALYRSYWPGKWGSAENSGPLGDGDWSVEFKPLLWLGDNERGLSFCAESDQGWVPADPKQVLEVTADRRLVAHLLDPPAKLSEPWQTSVMLHPTPIKPMPADPHHLRINHGGSYRLQSTQWHGPSSLISYDAAKLLDPRQGTLEAWISPAFDPQVEVKPAERAARGQLNRELFNVKLAKGDQAGFYWNIDDRGLRFYVRQGKSYPIVLGAPNGWRTGEVHQVALTWGDTLRIYADGKEVASRPFSGLFGNEVDLTGAKLTIGGSPCEFAVHALRVEQEARTKFDLDHAPSRTPSTTLLEIGPDVGRAAVGEPVTHTPGKFGPAACFYDPAAKPLSMLDALVEAGVKTLIFHESWTDIQDYGDTTHRAELKSLAEACHRRGLKLVVYFGYEMSNLAPEWEAWHERCLVAPRAGGYKRQPEQTAYIVCYQSPWRGFLLEGIANVVDQYGVDGVYLDGTIEPFGCANELHGCGYVGADGQRHKTYPILAVRETMRRMYHLLAARRTEVIIDAHQSLCMMTPTLSWCSGYWDGEQLTSGKALSEPSSPLEILPLATFRAEFMGRQFGVPAMFLNYSGRPFEPAQALAFSLLHDVTTRGHGLNDVQQLLTPVWRAFADFGRAGAVFVPYWNNGELVRVTGSDVYVSGYRKGHEAVLLVISNLGNTQRSAMVRLVDGVLTSPVARDALTREPLSVDGGTVTLGLEPLSYRLIELRSQR